ncbi:MAG: hypothetical protein ABEI57_01640 [Halapricum sp.]
MSTGSAGDAEETISVETVVKNDRTILTIEGERDVAVIVRSREGERIYLPPEDAVKGDQEVIISPYQAGTSASDDEDDDKDQISSPYERMGEGGGRSGFPSGIRIIHDEPATDVRVLR